MPKTASELMSDCWDRAADRGDKRPTVYAVLERYSVTPSNPAGELLTWSLNRGEVERYAARLPRLHRLVKIVPLD